MKSPPFAVAACVFILLAACGGGGDGDNGGGGLQDDGPMLCPDTYTTGRGLVWRGHDPFELEERDLPALDGEGHLTGYYIGSIDPSSGETAYSQENEFLYYTDDARLNQVQAYYVITHMANWLIGYFSPSQEYQASIDLIRSDRVNLQYNREEVQSQQLCYELNMGMQGLNHDLLNVDVFAHEFGHHVVFSLNRQLANSMVHEAMADYLAASFTRNSAIEPSDWNGFDRNLENDHVAPDDVITRGEYCALLLGRMEADGIDSEYPSLAATFSQCRQENPQEPEPHWASMILSGALWELRRQIGEPDFNPALFRTLHNYTINDTGDLMENLIESDGVLNSGQNEQLIRDTFAARGIDQDLNLGFADIPYPDCP
jgi:hypothetical protein